MHLRTVNPGKSTRRGFRRLSTLAVSLAVIVTPIIAAPAASASEPGETQTSFDSQMLTLVNNARVSAGVAKLKSDPGLVSLSAWWSRQMANGEPFDHNPDAWTMVTTYGASNRTKWAENVAGFSAGATAQAVFNAYMASPDHKANILSANYKYVGIGTVAGSAEYNTMEFTDKVDASGCHPYSDVSASYVHCHNIQWVAQEGISDPTGGSYHATNAMTRYEMAAFLYRLTHQKDNAPACTSKPFPDIAKTNAYCGYVTWVKNSHIAYGYSDGDYHGGNAVTRGAMAAYLYRAAHDGAALPGCTSKPFPDVPVSNEFCGAIKWMKTTGISTGYGDGTYRPDVDVTRGAMASFVHRADAYI